MLLMLVSAADYLSGYGDDALVLNERDAAGWLSDKEGVIFSGQSSNLYMVSGKRSKVSC